VAFDSKNADDLLALKTEVNNDPNALGYASLLDTTALVLTPYETTQLI